MHFLDWNYHSQLMYWSLCVSCVFAVSVLDCGENLSDHCPVSLDLHIPCSHVPTGGHSHLSSGLWSKQRLAFRWNKNDIVAYYQLTQNLLSNVQAPSADGLFFTWQICQYCGCRISLLCPTKWFFETMVGWANNTFKRVQGVCYNCCWFI